MSKFALNAAVNLPDLPRERTAAPSDLSFDTLRARARNESTERFIVFSPLSERANKYISRRLFTRETF